MISGHTAMVRRLHGWFEQAGLPWSGVHLEPELDDSGRIVRDAKQLDAWFIQHNKKVDLVLRLPGEHEGKPIPNGRLAARVDDTVVKGPLDDATWIDILAMIRGINEH